jgi:hypothetical protein
MNKYVFIFLTFGFLQYIYGQENLDFELSKFKPLPEKYNTAYRANLFEKVIPEKEYKYWEYVFYDDIFPENENEIYRGKIIVSKGDKKNYSFLTKDVTANYGFFIECHPAICYSYIVAVRADLTIDLVKSETDLKKFIGKVDNIEEVIS